MHTNDDLGSPQQPTATPRVLRSYLVRPSWIPTAIRFDLLLQDDNIPGTQHVNGDVLKSSAANPCSVQWIFAIFGVQHNE